MIFKDFEFKKGNYFVGMEYYRLILNRTFLILLTDDCLLGILANGLVSVEGGHTIIAHEISKSMAVRGDLLNPLSYVKEKYIQKIENEDIAGESILLNNKTNFRIAFKNIADVRYDQQKKWGMGNYPHDGKIYIKTNEKKTREFIIMGNQSGASVRDWLLQKIK